MSSSSVACDSNQPCTVGLCCDIASSSLTYLTCSAVAGSCYTADGSLDLWKPCTHSSQCATRCCDTYWKQCLAHSINCVHSSSSFSQTALVLTLFFIFFLIFATLLIIICLLRRRRHRRRRIKVRAQTATTVTAKTISKADSRRETE